MSHERRGDLALIKAALQERCLEVCRALLPNGRVEGGLYVAHDPVAGDYDKKPALKVRLHSNIGGWAAFRGEARPVRHDILGLVEYVRGGDVGDALRWARDFLGFKQMNQVERERVRAAAAVRVQEQVGRQERLRAWKIARARQMFEGAAIGIFDAGAAHGRAYFEQRGVDLREVATLAAGNLRFEPRAEYWPDALWEERGGKRVKVKEGRRLPAVHAAVRAQDGTIVGCHVTYLDEILPAKAAVDKPKLMFGAISGAVLEIATGQLDGGRVGKPFWREEQGNLLIVCEGIETGLSLAVAVPEARIWAALSLMNMGNVPVGLDCVEAVIVARDGDEGNRQANKQLEAALELLEAWGKVVKVMQSHVGDDFNDLMKGESNG